MPQRTQRSQLPDSTYHGQCETKRFCEARTADAARLAGQYDHYSSGGRERRIATASYIFILAAHALLKIDHDCPGNLALHRDQISQCIGSPGSSAVHKFACV